MHGISAISNKAYYLTYSKTYLQFIFLAYRTRYTKLAHKNDKPFLMELGIFTFNIGFSSFFDIFFFQDTSAENFSKRSIKLTESLSSMAAQAAADQEMGALNIVSCTTS